MKNLAALLCLAALAFPSTAIAQNQKAPSDTSLVLSVGEADLGALVRVEGHTVEGGRPFEDLPSVKGKTAEGLVFVLIGTACEGEAACRGIMMQVRYDADERVTTAGINEANVNEAAVNSWWDQANNVVGFTRYVVLDDGVTWLNIRQNLRVLLAIQENASAIVFP